MYVECILKTGRSYYFNLTHVGLNMLNRNQVNSLDHGQTVSILHEAFLADPDTRTTGLICPNICLATLGEVDILLVFSDCFTGPSLTVEVFCKWWCSKELALNFKFDKF